MYINIDLDQMRVVHKHRDINVLNMLAYIECQCACATIPCGSVRALNEFTFLELQRIYEQSTGQKLSTYANHVARAVADMCMALPETDAVLEEATAQRLKIKVGDKSSFRYVRGSNTPEHVNGIFMPDAMVGTRSAVEGQTDYVPTESAPARPVWQPTAADREQAGAQVAAPAAPRAPREPGASTGRQGGTREIVFKVADQMWEAAGKPTVPSEVLALRKLIMTELENNHNVKRTTSSNTLGDWAKARIVAN